jgi:hypothetical protein
MSEICDHKGCTSPAAGRINLMIPVEGGSTLPGQCLRVQVGVLICVAHFLEEARSPATWCNAQMRQALKAAAAGQGKPDFARAYLDLERLS